jgi:hypothetical protein
MQDLQHKDLTDRETENISKGILLPLASTLSTNFQQTYSFYSIVLISTLRIYHSTNLEQHSFNDTIILSFKYCYSEQFRTTVRHFLRMWKTPARRLDMDSNCNSSHSFQIKYTIELSNW